MNRGHLFGGTCPEGECPWVYEFPSPTFTQSCRGSESSKMLMDNVVTVSSSQKGLS